MLRLVPRRASSPPEATDAELMANVAGGDLEALGQVYDRHAGALLSFLRYFAPRDEAEDVAQATFLRAMTLAGSFDPSALSARPWLFALATRLVWGRRRSLSRFTSALARLAREPVNHSTPREPTRDLERALSSLSEPKRLAFLLTEVEGFSAEEAAATLGVPVGTIWTRLHHARRELRALLGDHRQ